MTAYLIVWGESPADRFAAYAYGTRAEAQEASLRLVPQLSDDQRERLRPRFGAGAGGVSAVVERAGDVTFGYRLLCEVLNALTGNAVAKLENRATGIKRLFAALAERAFVHVPLQSDDPDPILGRPSQIEGTIMMPLNKSTRVGAFVPVRRGISD